MPYVNVKVAGNLSDEQIKDIENVKLILRIIIETLKIKKKK